MSKLAASRKMTLGEVSRELAIHPFDLIRVLVAHDRLPPCLTFTPEQVVEIRQVGGIETWWTPKTERPSDDIPQRGLLRALCGQLVARGCIGDNATRLDNLLRGLDTQEQLQPEVLFLRRQRRTSRGPRAYARVRAHWHVRGKPIKNNT